MAARATDSIHTLTFTVRGLGLVVVLCALTLLVPVTSTAAGDDRARLEDPFEITADRIDYDGRRDLYVATGNVRVVQTDRTMRADWVAFSTATRIGVAEGSVELVDAGDVLVSEFMVFDVDSLRGMLFEGGLDAGSQGFKVRAAEMVRTGENTFTVRDGVFSTCRCAPGERLPWQINAREADVTVGDYGTVKNATFDVLGVPVLWIPWAFFPVKSDRETGLLLPDFELGGRSGFGGGIPFFWAAHPQVNVTFTPRYLSERGFKGDGEIEYVFGERSEGELFVSGLNDQRDTDEAPAEISQSRWAVLWDHDQELPFGWRWQTDAKFASDNFYSDDFIELREYKEFRFIESVTQVNRRFGDSGGIGVFAGTRVADDVQGSNLPPANSDFADSDDFLLQRFGEAQVDIQPGAVTAPGGLDFRLDSEVVYFGALRNHESVFDDQPFRRNTSNGHFYDVGIDGIVGGVDGGVPASPELDGLFQPGEAIAERGARVVLHPRVARPFRLGRVAEITPEIGWRETLYHTDQQRFGERGQLTARIEARNRLFKDYARDQGLILRHVLEPRLGWAFVTQRKQRRNPLFTPEGEVVQARLRSLSLESVTRDPSDRVGTANKVVLGLGQRFYTRRGERGLQTLRADIQAALDWDFAEEGLGNINLEARLFQVGPFNTRLRGSVDPEKGAVDESEIEINVRKRIDDVFENSWVREVRLAAGHRYRRRVPTFLEANRGAAELGRDDSVNQLNVSASIELTARWRFKYSTIYKLAGRSEFIRNQGTIEYASKCRCWAVGATVSNDRRDQIAGGFSFHFLGLGDDSGDRFTSGFGTGVNF